MSMYYIAYIIIGLGLGGVVFLLIKKLPQFFSKGEAEFDTLLRKREKKSSLWKKFNFDRLKKKIKNYPFARWKDKLIRFSKNVFTKVSSAARAAGKKLKNLFKESSAWFGGLIGKVNLRINSKKGSDSESRELKKREQQTPEKKDRIEPQEEFFSELLGAKEAEQQTKESSSVAESSQQSVETEETPEEKEAFSKEEKEIQQWIEKLKEEPRNQEAYMELGFIYFEQGQKEKAKSCFESAKKLGIENGRVDELLSKLEE